jgi:ribose 5-phosphate isomerase B
LATPGENAPQSAVVGEIMRIAIACDHAGFPLKESIVLRVRAAGHEVVDCGTHDGSPVDYPDYAWALGRALQEGRAERGILVCGSGVGACVAANKMSGIRASVCHDTYSAAQGVDHDDMNVLCLGGRVIGEALALELVAAFLSASFTNEERHLRRLRKVLEIERGNPPQP